MRDFQLPGRSTVYATGGIAATSHPIGARVAVETLARGGNAVDAAIAGAVVLGLCEPAMTGIGGDMFALVATPDGEIIGLNGSGRAPAAASAAALRDKGHAFVDINGPESVVVPGAIAGFERLAADHGRLGLDALLAPAIAYADEGIPVAPRAAFDWALAEPRLRGAARMHYLMNGAAFPPGAIFRAPGQAEVLRRVAKQGARGFYEGEVAADMVASLRALGGVHEEADFAAARADYVTPISAPYRGHEIVELPPNGHGATALLMAGILGHFDLGEMEPFGPDRAHVEVEAAKLAYAARNEAIADPDHMRITVAEFLDPGRARALAGAIRMDKAAPLPPPAPGAFHRDTIYITVVDRDRMAVSLIYSIFHSFGAGLASERFGINFNNRAAGFVLTPGHPNEMGASKRPLHTIIPGILKRDGRVVMPFGVMGGGYQPHGHMRLVSNIVDFGMDVQDAIDAPRLFLEDGVLGLERGYAPAVWNELTRRGHPVGPRQVAIGGAQAIQIDHERGILIGGSDPRKDGIALGL